MSFLWWRHVSLVTIRGKGQTAKGMFDVTWCPTHLDLLWNEGYLRNIIPLHIACMYFEGCVVLTLPLILHAICLDYRYCIVTSWSAVTVKTLLLSIIKDVGTGGAAVEKISEGNDMNIVVFKSFPSGRHSWQIKLRKELTEGLQSVEGGFALFSKWQ